MAITEISAKSLLRKQKHADSWFLSWSGMNLYRGCAHDCSYCDGRAEGYYVEGTFGRDVFVKINAPDLLRRELDPRRRRTPIPGGFILLGGGVGDSYQPIEERYCLARRCLMAIAESGHPVHVLTKSCLVERDLDLLSAINDQRKAVLSMSFSTVDDALASILEPGVSPPTQRLATLSRAKKAGLSTGMYLMPLVPFVTDGPSQIDAAIHAAKSIGVDFVICSGMTLKPGRQRMHFESILEKHFPEKLVEYRVIYGDNPWGSARGDYYESLNRLLASIARHHRMPIRMPRRRFGDLMDRRELTIVLLEHCDYFQRLGGGSSPYGYAARSIAQTGFTAQELRWALESIKGVGPVVRKAVIEILETGTAQVYEMLSGELWGKQ